LTRTSKQDSLAPNQLRRKSMPSKKQKFVLGTLGATSGAFTGLALGALADGTEGAVVPGLGQDTIRMQNYALLALAFAVLGLSMGIKLNESRVSKMAILFTLVGAYTGLSFADSAANAVSDPTNSLQIPASVASPAVTVAMISFFALVAAALSSSPATQNTTTTRNGEEYRAVRTGTTPGGAARTLPRTAEAEQKEQAQPLFSAVDNKGWGFWSPARPRRTAVTTALPLADAAGAINGDTGNQAPITPPRATSAQAGLRQRTPGTTQEQAVASYP
jgi:hypothetical protein